MPTPRGPGSSGRYLYIAIPEGEPGTFKVGRSHQLVKAREQALGGQTTVEHKIVRIVPTDDEVLAEKLTFDEFDKNGWRKTPGSRKELFSHCTIEQLLEVMERQCRVATNNFQLTKQSYLAHARSFQEPGFLPQSCRVEGSNKLQRALLASEVKHLGKRITLGQFLSLALEDGRLFKRLESWGMTYRATTLKTLDIQVHWGHDSGLLKTLRLMGIALPKLPSSAIRFKMRAHA